MDNVHKAMLADAKAKAAYWAAVVETWTMTAKLAALEDPKEAAEEAAYWAAEAAKKATMTAEANAKATKLAEFWTQKAAKLAEGK